MGVCDYAENFQRGPALHLAPALRMVNERLSNPDVAVVPVLAPGEEPPDRDNSGPALHGKQRLLPREVRRDGLWLWSDSALAVARAIGEKL